MKKSDLDKEIDLTLSSLDDIQKAKAPDDFLTTLTSKMIFRNEQKTWMRRAKYAIAAMIMFAIVNTVLLINSMSSDREEMLDSVATEWNLKAEGY